MKVAAYTIALNEAPHAERWARSAADADYRVVADKADGPFVIFAGESASLRRDNTLALRWITARDKFDADLVFIRIQGDRLVRQAELHDLLAVRVPPMNGSDSENEDQV
jgi:hypothetical protein